MRQHTSANHLPPHGGVLRSGLFSGGLEVGVSLGGLGRGGRPDLPEGAAGEEEVVEAGDGGGVEDEHRSGGRGEAVQDGDANAQAKRGEDPEDGLQQAEEGEGEGLRAGCAGCGQHG